MAEFTPPPLPAEENEAPDPVEFCLEVPNVSIPAIHFFGGLVIEPQVDPTRGSPGSCGVTLDLASKLQAALAPLQPLFTILDMLAGIVQCFLLLVDVVTNPFKIPDLLKCIPGLIEKFNSLLALIPVFPQGIVLLVTMIVDIIRFVALQIGCVVDILESIQNEVAGLSDLIRKIDETDDAVIRANLQLSFDCGLLATRENQSSALLALGPIARILCTIRAFLSIIPGGREIADKLAFTDPSKIEALDSAITALKGLSKGLLDVVGLVELLATPFGGLIPAPGAGFVCALDSAFTIPTPEALPIPTVTSLQAPPPTVNPNEVPLASPGDPDVDVVITGIDFIESSQVFWQTSKIAKVVFSNETTLTASIPADLRTVTGDFLLAVVNAPPSTPVPADEDAATAAAAIGPPSFGGLSSEAGAEPADTGTEVSNQHKVTVVVP